MPVENNAFTGLAQSYREARPTYPAELTAIFAEAAREALTAPHPLLVDVGAGTGISTFALLAALPPACRAIGVEPNADMRAEAMAARPAGRDVTFVEGSDRALPIEDGTAALVTAGQAAHWFDRPAFYAEAMRILRPGGAVAIFENNRNWRASPFLARHEAFLEEHAIAAGKDSYSRFYRDHPYAQELFRAFGNVRAARFGWTREMTVGGFLTMARSSTKVQRALAHLGEEAGLATMRAYCEAHADAAGTLAVPYVSEVYFAVR